MTDNPATAMRWLDKSTLEIDSSYQRVETLNTKRVKDIAENFDPALFLPLTVVKRPDSNKFYVVDGQHRLEGVRHNDSIKKIACHVIECHNIKEEARLFHRLNTKRTSVSSANSFKALAFAGDTPQAEIDAFLRSIEFPAAFNSNKYGIKCLGEVISAWEINERWARGALIQIRDLNYEHKTQANVRVFKALFGLAIGTHGASLEPFWTERILKRGGQPRFAAMLQETAGDNKNIAFMALVIGQDIMKGVKSPHPKLTLTELKIAVTKRAAKFKDLMEED